MSLAFAAVELFLLFAPGVIFRRSYLSYPFSKRFSASSASDEVLWAIIPAIALHLLGLAVLGLCWPQYGVDFQTLGVLLVGAKDDAASAAAFGNLGEHLWSIAGYNAGLYLLAVASGGGARQLVLRFELDRKFQVFRFNNDWYYLLTGRQWGLRHGRDFDVVWIDALVSTGKEVVIYSGVFDHFFLSRDGGLDSLCLREASRAPLQAYPPPERIEIPGEALVLKYEEIRNLNLAFYSLQDAAPADAE